MHLNNIRIVLVGTTHPGNIGAAARAMKTMGLDRLYLVSPKVFPHRLAHEMAAGADDLLQHAVITTTLREALHDCHRIFATSARPRDIALPGLLPEACADQIATYPDKTEVAIVFGREHAGLTNDELLQCHYHVHIPSNPAFSSLNLAQSVQVIAYVLRMRHQSLTATAETHATTPATAQAMALFYDHLRDVLIAIDFLKPSNPKRLLQRLRRLFNRTQLDETEVNILRGILTQIQSIMRRTMHEVKQDNHD